MTMRTLRRRLNPDAVYRAAIKSNDRKHQMKFMSGLKRMEIGLDEAAAAMAAS